MSELPSSLEACHSNPALPAARERITAIDTVRGVAVLGILLLNIISFGLPHAYNDPTIAGGHEGFNLWAFAINHLFFEGAMRGLFSMLFGASVIMLTVRPGADNGQLAEGFFRRNGWLFVFGVCHGWLLLWYGDVLYWYALAGMFLYPLRHLSPRSLTILGLIMLATLLPRSLYKVNDAQTTLQLVQQSEQVQAAGNELSEAMLAARAHWAMIESWRKPSEAQLQAEVEALRGSYWSVLTTLAPVIRAYQSTILYEGGFFDAMGGMLLGMALFKWGVLSGRRSQRFYLAMMTAGYGVGLAVNGWELWAMLQSGFSLISVLKWGFLGVTYDLGRIPMTLGHLALIHWLIKAGYCRWLWQLLATAGRMALTNYVMQSAICALLFYGFGLGLYGALQRYELMLLTVAIWIVQLSFSHYWFRWFEFGPLEWLWRSLTRGQRQPLRRRC